MEGCFLRFYMHLNVLPYWPRIFYYIYLFWRGSGSLAQIVLTCILLCRSLGYTTANNTVLFLNSRKLCDTGFSIEPRGAVEIKGKGLMNTYFLNSTALEWIPDESTQQDNNETTHKMAEKIADDSTDNKGASNASPVKIIARDVGVRLKQRERHSSLCVIN